MSKIYTKQGDEGKSRLLGGDEVTKDCINLHVVGEMDELNSVLGITVSFLEEGTIKFSELVAELRKIQKDLFKAGAEISALQSQVEGKVEKVGIAEIENLEKKIDEWWAAMPELKNFIIPGGTVPAGFLHHARTICRRTERELVHLGKEKQVRPELYKYFNRLSDFLFTAARWVNHQLGKEEGVV